MEEEGKARQRRSEIEGRRTFQNKGGSIKEKNNTEPKMAETSFYCVDMRARQTAGETLRKADLGLAVKGLFLCQQTWHFLQTKEEPSVAFK